MTRITQEYLQQIHSLQQQQKPRNNPETHQWDTTQQKIKHRRTMAIYNIVTKFRNVTLIERS
jgi:hypothetical protein